MPGRRLQWLAVLMVAGCTMQPTAEAERFEIAEQVGSVLFLRGAQQVEAFRNQRTMAPTRRVGASDKALALPLAASSLDDQELQVRLDGRLVPLATYLEEDRFAGFLVLKNGEIAYEHYALGNDEKSRWISFSVAKSVVSLLLGAAIKDGYIRSVDEPVVDYLPRLRASSYEGATIKDLLQMASGVAWNEDYADPDSDVASANYESLALYEHLRRKEKVARPGERFNYNTAETNLAGTLLRSAIGNNLATYLEHKIWRPFGMADDAYWNLTENAGGEFGGCCINATLRDYARLGLFALAEGELADGTKVLPDDWMAQSVAPSPSYQGYGYFWWLFEGRAYSALGIFGQTIYVNPASGVVIATHGAWNDADTDRYNERRLAAITAIEAALAAQE